MPMLTHRKIKSVLEQIIVRVTELDSYFNEDPIKPLAAGPATEEELKDLEHHWGCPLPPSYRAALSVCNGISHFWSDADLLSTRDIIEGRYEIQTFEEPFPKLWRFIFCCETDSYDALCFDISKAKDDGEMPVVQLSDEGEVKRWSRFDAFLASYLSSLKKEIREEKEDRKQLDG